MAQIRSGASSDLMTVDATSKAARVSAYDALGVYRGPKATYRTTSAAVVAAAASGEAFFEMLGSSTKIVRLQRLIISGLTLTAVAYLGVNLNKLSASSSGGTSSDLSTLACPVDSTFAAATLAAIRFFTAAPTSGTRVGVLASRRVLGQATTAAAAGIPATIAFDFRGVGESKAPTLNSATQGFDLRFASAPASAVSMMLEVEWTEE